MSYDAQVIAQIPLGMVEADENFNARRIYDPGRIEALAESIKAIGLETPLEVSRKPDGSGYFLIAGFRRRRALYKIHGDDAAKVQVPCRIVSEGTLAERMLRNLVSDEGHEPVRRCDQARRFHYLIAECGVPLEHLARVATLKPAFVEQLVTCWKNLSPAIRDAWEKSQSREREIPLGLLVSWSKLPVEDQRKAFEAYLDPDAAYRGATGEELDDEFLAKDFEPPKPKPRKPRRGAKFTPAKILSASRIQSARDQLQKDRDMNAEKRGALKALAWVLGETESINFARLGGTEKGTWHEKKRS